MVFDSPYRVALSSRCTKKYFHTIMQKMTLLLCFAFFARCLSAQQPTLVADINSGTGHAFQRGEAFSETEKNHRIAYQGKVYFSANTAATGYELWASDGTAAGTQMVKDIRPGTAGCDIADMAVSQGKLYFIANDGATGRELWVTDGTEAGTRLVKDIRPGATGSTINDLTPADDALYFVANNLSGSAGIWKSDGTETGTVEIDPNVNYGPGGPIQLTKVDDKVYFGQGKRYLSVTDGTLFGTQIVKDLGFGINPFVPMYVYQGRLHFSADETGGGNYEPWMSVAGFTTKLKEIVAGSQPSNPVKFFGFKNFVYFAANNKLYRTDGTAAGTTLFYNVQASFASNDQLYFVADANYMYFQGDDGFKGKELWRTDGTAAGTVMVKNIDPTSSSSFPAEMIIGADGLLYFHAAAESDYQLWRSDGTEVGTVMITNLNLGTGLYLPQSPVMVGSTLFYIADDGISGRELWKLQLTSGTHAPQWSEGLFTATPNPADDLLRISLSADPDGGAKDATTVYIFDQQGRTVASQQWDAPATALTLPVSNLRPGFYLVKVVSERRVFTKKIVVAH